MTEFDRLCIEIVTISNSYIAQDYHLCCYLLLIQFLKFIFWWPSRDLVQQGSLQKQKEIITDEL